MDRILLAGVLLVIFGALGSASGAERPQSMFYKAQSKLTGNMWDTWLYLHDGTY